MQDKKKAMFSQYENVTVHKEYSKNVKLFIMMLGMCVTTWLQKVAVGPTVEKRKKKKVDMA